MEAIGLILHISTKVKYKSNHNHYILDTTNSRAVENIINYFYNTMKGMKSVEYRICYVKNKAKFTLSKIREILIWEINYMKFLLIVSLVNKSKKN